jgi:hypothetical protein
MKQNDTYYNYDVDYLELSLPYIDGNGNVCTVSALYNVDHNILKQNFKENEHDNNPVILSYILHVTDNTYNTHDIEYKLKFKKYPQTVLFIDDIDNIKIYNNVDNVINCFSTYYVNNNEIKTYKPTIYNFLNAYGYIITPPDCLYTQIDGTFSLPEYINEKNVSYTYLLNLNYIKLPLTYTTNNTQQTSYNTKLLLGPTAYYYEETNKTYTFGPYGYGSCSEIDRRFLKEINVEKTNESLNFSIIPTNHHEDKLYSYTLENVSNICNINNLFKFKINNSYIYLSSYFSCKNYNLNDNKLTAPGFVTKFTKNYLSKKYVIYEDSYNVTTYITQNLQHIQTNNNKVYKYCLQYNNDPNQRVYAYSSTSYSLPKLITDNNIYYTVKEELGYNIYTYHYTYINKFKIDNVYSINNIILHNPSTLVDFKNNIMGYITYTYSYIIDNVLNITYINNDKVYSYLNTNLCIINYNSDNTPIYSIYHNDGTNKTNKNILKKLLLDCFRIYVHYDNSIVLKNITNIFNIKYTNLESELELELEQNTKNYLDSLDINNYKFERLYEDDFLNILTTKETFNKQSLLTLYDCYIISISLNTNKNIVSDIYIVIYNILGIYNTNTLQNENNIIYIEYSELLNLLADKKIHKTSIKFNGVNKEKCILLSETHNITYKKQRGDETYNITYQDQDYNTYKTKLYAYFNNMLSFDCNVNIENIWDEKTVYKRGFDNLIYENFYDVITYTNNYEYNKKLTKLHKYRYGYYDISFSYNGVSYSNSYTQLIWKANSGISLSIKSTPYKRGGHFPDEILKTEIGEPNNFNIEEYTFKYTYLDNNKVSYNYTYTCLYKCKKNDINYNIDDYYGDNIVINTDIYKQISDLTKDKFYKKYIIDNNTLSTINTFDYKPGIQERFYRIYLNKLKYNDNIEYILPTNNNLLKQLYKTNKSFKYIIDKKTNIIISEFNEDFIKLTLHELNINLNQIYNIKPINTANYIGNNKILNELRDKQNTYEIRLNKNYKLNTVILLYKYFKIIEGSRSSYNEIYFYYINNKFYVVVDNLSYIKDIIVEYEYKDENNTDKTNTMKFHGVIKNDNTIKGLYQLIRPFNVTEMIMDGKEYGNIDMDSTSTGNTGMDNPPITIRPVGKLQRMYFINNPIPSENDNVILVNEFNNIIENWGKITSITYSTTKNINIIPLLYNEYDNGLSDDDKQLLLDAINETSYSNGYDNDFPGGKVEVII